MKWFKAFGLILCLVVPAAYAQCAGTDCGACFGLKTADDPSKDCSFCVKTGDGTRVCRDSCDLLTETKVPEAAKCSETICNEFPNCTKCLATEAQALKCIFCAESVAKVNDGKCGSAKCTGAKKIPMKGPDCAGADCGAMKDDCPDCQAGGCVYCSKGICKEGKDCTADTEGTNVEAGQCDPLPKECKACIDKGGHFWCKTATAICMPNGATCTDKVENTNGCPNGGGAGALSTGLAAVCATGFALLQ